MMDRKEKVVEALVKGVETILQSQRVAVKYGHADLFGGNRVALFSGGEKKETIEADAIVLAPGSTSKILPDLVPDGEKIITSDEALKLKKVPDQIAIIGGGYIGAEFATIFNGLGSKVVVVEVLENILLGLEGELVRNLRRFMERDGIKFLTKSKVEDLQSVEAGLRLKIRTPQGAETFTAEKVLLAVGRAPNLNLDFSKAGVEVFSTGIRVNRRMETSTSHIYAIGDAIGGTLLAHLAMEEGIVAAENATGGDRQMEDDPIPVCIFTYPELSSIGLTEKEAKEKGEIRIGRFPFRSNPTALISGEEDGLIKVIVDRENDRILGVHIIGHDAGSLIAVAASLMRQGIKSKEFSRFIQAHPTTPEALREAFLDVDGMAIHLPKPLRQKA
jgi:dihydrolipoamide dehydrogenase